MVLLNCDVEIGNSSWERVATLTSRWESLGTEGLAGAENFAGLARMRCELIGKGGTYGF